VISKPGAATRYENRVGGNVLLQAIRKTRVAREKQKHEDRRDTNESPCTPRLRVSVRRSAGSKLSVVRIQNLIDAIERTLQMQLGRAVRRPRERALDLPTQAHELPTQM